MPLARWRCADLARAAVDQGITAAISDTTIWRWLSADAIKPWRHRSWIFPRDPDFAVKAARVLDLYARTYQGIPLGPDDYVISADELGSDRGAVPGLRSGPFPRPARRTRRAPHDAPGSPRVLPAESAG